MILDTETPKMEQGREQQPRLLDSSKEGSSMNHLSPESSPKMQGTGENKHNQAVAAVLTPTPDVSLPKSNCGSNYTAQLLSSVTSTNINGHLNALDMQNEEPLQTVNAKPNFLLKLNPDHSLGKIDSGFHTEFLCSKINQNTLLAESKMKVPPNELDETAQDTMHVDNEQLVGTIITKESPSKELILKTRNHVKSSERGILKRNPR
ncbi:hypothetical protein LIER_24310 [Lithospermum erythrorhizon]|uniref:Uncharacterized protein n=1 Tax=Lithospermum erythrorhizon TaxID=34254 RepID=A0AAV3R6E0_LITER